MDVLRRPELADAVIETAGCLVFVMDSLGRIVRFNGACERLTGYREHEIVGRRPWDLLLPPDHAARVRDAFPSMRASDFPIRSSTPWVARDGILRHLEWSTSALTGPTGAIEHVVGTGIDVTAQVDADAALRESEELHRSVFTAMAEGVIVVDREWRVTACNTSAERLLGKGLLRTRVEPFSALDEHGALIPFDELPYAVTMRTGEPVSGVLLGLPRPDGGLVWLSTATQPLRREGERQPHAVVLTFSDVTAEREARMLLDETTATLSRIAASIDDHLYTGEILADARYRELYAGPGLEKLLGGTPPPFVDQGDLWNDRVHPEDRVAYDRFHRAALRGAPGELEYRLIGLDGRVRWIHDRYRVRIEGDRTLIDGITSDVSERREAIDRLARRERDLEVALSDTRDALDELDRARAVAERLARTDPLTGASNRRHLSELLDEELREAPRLGRTPALLILDLDRFKRVNDTLGHAVGDDVLIEAVARVTGAVRAGDAVARWGGEEIAVLLCDLPDDDALRQVAEGVRRAIADRPFLTPAGPLAVTVSVGAVRAGRVDGRGLVEAADRALYAAKRRGRDRVCLFGDLTPFDAVAEEPEAVRIAQALALAAGVREGELAAHARDVARLAGAIAQELRLGEAAVLRCQLGGWLHDVGKLGVPDQVLRKPGPLDEAEWELMRGHAAAGAELVARVPGIADVAPIVRHHHERLDGTGYPDRLAGDAIPLEARIVACADAYSAMVSPRVYAVPRTALEALTELQGGAGAQHDRRVVDALALVLAYGDAEPLAA